MTEASNVFGARYESYWKTSEAAKNLLRTHTTAVSARMLYRLAKSCRDGTGEFQPAKYFSIDRVFRNEAIDRTHLAEFHQVEGVRSPPDYELFWLNCDLDQCVSPSPPPSHPLHARLEVLLQPCLS